MFQKQICPPWCKIQFYLHCRSKTCSKKLSKGLKYIKWTTHLAPKSGWPWPLNMWPENQIGRNPCTKFGIDQINGPKDIEQTTQWAEKSGLTLTFEHVTWIPIGIIYSLRATPAPSLVLIKWRGQKILSGQHLAYRPTDRTTERQMQNKMPLFSRGA